MPSEPEQEHTFVEHRKNFLIIWLVETVVAASIGIVIGLVEILWRFV